MANPRHIGRQLKSLKRKQKGGTMFLDKLKRRKRKRSAHVDES